MTDTPSVGVEALHELRAARRRRRIQDLDWFEAAYRAYLTGIVGIVITLLLSSWLGDEPVDASTLADVLKHGPAAIGLVAALALGLGLRSGSRGGPLAVEAAELRYVLLSPLRRRDVLMGGALKSGAPRRLPGRRRRRGRRPARRAAARGFAVGVGRLRRGDRAA